MPVEYHYYSLNHRPKVDIQTCIFCDSTARTTEEHFFPKWLQKHLKNNEGFTTHWVKILDQPPAPGAHYGEGKVHNKSLKVVCDVCNNQWMSELQTRAKPLLLPMILGTYSQMTAAQQSIVARWAAMFTMVAEFDDSSGVTTSFEERKIFATGAYLHNNWHVWVAPFNRQQNLSSQRDHLFGHNIGYDYPLGPVMPWSWQTTAFSIGQLLVLTASSTCHKTDELGASGYKVIDEEFGILRVKPPTKGAVTFQNMILPNCEFDNLSQIIGRIRGARPFSIDRVGVPYIHVEM